MSEERELAWTRAERELVRRVAQRDAASVDGLYAGVRDRIARDRRRRRWSLGVAAAAMAAAALVLAPRLREDEEAPPAATAALQQAREQYLAAISVLESSVEQRERGLPNGDARQRRSARAQARAQISRSRSREGSAGMRELEGYAAYLRSLRRQLDAETL